MCALGMAEELKPDGVAVNTLWPRTGRIAFFSLEPVLEVRPRFAVKQMLEITTKYLLG